MNVRSLGLIVCLNLAALPIAMRPLLITLVGAQRTGGFAGAGLAGGAAAAGMALTAPWWSRALLRYGDARVLLVSGALFAGVQLALAASHGPALFAGVAAVAGLCTPPVASSLRAMVPRLTSGGLTRAYAVNSVAQEIIYIGGPLWVMAWVTLAGPAAALAASTVAGTVALAAGITLTTRVRGPARRDGSSRLAVPAFYTLGGTYLAYWICMGAMWVLLPAFADRAGGPGRAGLLVAVWSAGSLLGGLTVTARPLRAPLRNSYLWLLTVLAVTSLPLALPTTAAAMAVAVGAFGLALAPWLAVSDQLVMASVGERRSGELYGWLTTIGQVGGAVGAAIAGPLADRYHGGSAFLEVTAALGIGLAIALGRRHTLSAEPG
ncbi:MAG: hypothetical protein JOY82_24460 [Streptosporangiaceae bacterium]|nr:hypothetical protein [Streptosporangiaceae bacterium]MBV9857636.1 hypothetical protein [Streptosporangiaceae bacterium]